MDFGFEAISELVTSDSQIVVTLQVHPKLGGRIEIAAQTQYRVGGDGTLAVDTFVSTRRAATPASSAKRYWPRDRRNASSNTSPGNGGYLFHGLRPKW